MMAKDPYRYFRVEARELLEGLIEGVLRLEQGEGGAELPKRLLRLAHTLKGAARVVRVTRVAELAHTVEDLLEPLRHGGRMDRGAIDRALAVLDEAAEAVAGLDEAPARGVAGAAPGAAARAAGDGGSGPGAGHPVGGGAAGGAATGAERGMERPAPRAVPTPEPLDAVRVDALEVESLLSGLAEATVQLSRTRRDLHDLEQARRLASVLVEHVRPRDRAAGRPAAATRIAPVVEELAGALARATAALDAHLEQTQRDLAQVHERAGLLRLQPARSAFPALERAVRDAARELGRQARFEASGGDHRVDAKVLAGVRDALLHLVRNAVAHGIEPEDERVAAGKAAAGTVRVQVRRQADAITFTCADDGRGVDVRAVGQAAARRGVLAPQQVQGLGFDGAVDLLLQGGVSTSRQLTGVAGRGVGLDTARDIVERLGGAIAIDSTQGQGTAVTLRVPARVAALPVLDVEAAGHRASIPLHTVRTVAVAQDDDLVRSGGAAGLPFEGKVIPFLPLVRALAPGTPPPPGGARRHSVVVVRAGEDVAAIGVDRMVGTSHVVVRPVPPQAAPLPVVSGAILDPEGRPQLVLDAGALVAAARASEATTPEQPAAPPPILVIDDSLTTRALEQSILESAGYEVDLAASAEEGLAMAERRRYGVFVVDVEMPGMNGFEFIEHTRAHPTLGTVPAILVTSRGSAEDRLRGSNAGACGYLVKSEFDQGALLDLIRRSMV